MSRKQPGNIYEIVRDALWPREIITQVLKRTCEILIRMSWRDLATVKQKKIPKLNVVDPYHRILY